MCKEVDTYVSEYTSGKYAKVQCTHLTKLDAIFSESHTLHQNARDLFYKGHTLSVSQQNRQTIILGLCIKYGASECLPHIYFADDGLVVSTMQRRLRYIVAVVIAVVVALVVLVVVAAVIVVVVVVLVVFAPVVAVVVVIVDVFIVVVVDVFVVGRQRKQYSASGPPQCGR